MFGGVFNHVDPMRSVQTSFEGEPLLDVLLSEYGWTRDNIGPANRRFEREETVVRDENGRVKNRYQVIRPSQIVRDGLSEIVSLKNLLKPRKLLPIKAIILRPRLQPHVCVNHNPFPILLIRYKLALA